MIKNDILLRVLKGEKTKRPPVWMMRQAGRYLPEFMELKNKYDFFTRCQTPELATEITLQPIKIINPDAAILFSDILVLPQSMGVHIDMIPGTGPYIKHPIRSQKDIKNLIIPDIYEHLGYVMEAIKMVKKELSNEIPLIGFAGSPWTIMCYLVNGQGSKTYDVVKRFCFEKPHLAHELLQKITDTTILYLQEKIKAGCDVIQLFDSWGGVLSPKDYNTFSCNYIQQIVEALSPKVPIIVFAKGCWFALKELSKMPVSGLGIDWTCHPKFARANVSSNIVLQGNFDPSRLFSPIPEIQKMVKQMIDDFGNHNYIANLGHGVLPEVPVEHVKAFINAVKHYN